MEYSISTLEEKIHLLERLLSNGIVDQEDIPEYNKAIKQLQEAINVLSQLS